MAERDDSDDSDDQSLTVRTAQLARVELEVPTFLSRGFLKDDNIDAIIDMLIDAAMDPIAVYKSIARWCATHKSACEHDTFWRALRVFHVDTSNVAIDAYQIVPVLWSTWKSFFADAASLHSTPVGEEDTASKEYAEMWGVVRWGIARAGFRNGDGIWAPRGPQGLDWLRRRAFRPALAQRQLDGLLEGLVTGFADAHAMNDSNPAPTVDNCVERKKLLEWHVRQWFKNGLPLRSHRYPESARRGLDRLNIRGPGDPSTTLWALLRLRGAGAMMRGEYDSLDRELYVLVWRLLRAVRQDVVLSADDVGVVEDQNPLQYTGAIAKEVEAMLKRAANLHFPPLTAASEPWLQAEPSAGPRLRRNPTGLQVLHMALLTRNADLVSTMLPYARPNPVAPTLLNELDYVALVEFCKMPHVGARNIVGHFRVSERLLGEVIDDIARDYAKERSRGNHPHHAIRRWMDFVPFAKAVFDGLSVGSGHVTRVAALKDRLNERWQVGGGAPQDW